MSNALICPFIYEFDVRQLAKAKLISYVMPLRAYEALKRAQSIDTNKNADIRGVEPILAWVAPSVDCAFIDRIDVASPPRSLHFWMYSPQKDLEALKKELHAALTMWIGLVAPTGKEEILAALSDERSARAAWREEQIELGLVDGKVCASPKDSRVFDLLTVHAARLLEGKTLSVQGYDRGILVPTGPRQSLFAGKTLFRADPHAVEKKNDGFAHHWTETFNVTSLSTPEQNRIRVGLSISIRNFVPIRRQSFAKGRARYVDVFLKSDGLSAKDHMRQQAISIPITRADFDALREGSIGGAGTSPSLGVLQRLLSVHGQERLQFSKDERLAAVTSDRLSVYPRGGSGHGDRYLAGATGISSPDRKDYLDFLDSHFIDAGFSRVALERRGPSRVSSFKRISKNAGQEPALIRNATVRALHFANQSNVLNITVLSARPETITKFVSAASEFFGTPDSQSASEMHYSDGLTVKIHSLGGGPFCTRLSDPEAALTDLPADLSSLKRRQAKRSALENAAAQRLSDMQKHLGSLPHMEGVSAAIVEMDAKIVEEPERDPYNLVYKALAARSIIGQVVLFDPEEESQAESSTTEEHRIKSALRDILRSLGVSFAKSPLGNEDALSLQAWWVVNLNSDRFDKRPGAAKAGAVMPIAVRYGNGVLEACATSVDGNRKWKPYPFVLIDLELGKCQNLGDLRQKELSAAVGQFYASVAAEISERAVILCDATNIRQYIKGLGNANLKFDDLPLGEVGAAGAAFTVTGNDNLSIVRLCTDPAKSPSYWVTENVQGVAAGMFAEPSALRTLWVSRGLPRTMQQNTKTRVANKQSRYLGDEQIKANLNDRRFPSLSELCVVVQGKGIEPNWLATLTRKAMSVHTTTDDITLLPFPLHEAQLLANAAR